MALGNHGMRIAVHPQANVQRTRIHVVVVVNTLILTGVSRTLDFHNVCMIDCAFPEDDNLVATRLEILGHLNWRLRNVLHLALVDIDARDAGAMDIQVKCGGRGLVLHVEVLEHHDVLHVLGEDEIVHDVTAFRSTSIGVGVAVIALRDIDEPAIREGSAVGSGTAHAGVGGAVLPAKDAFDALAFLGIPDQGITPIEGESIGAAGMEIPVEHHSFVEARHIDPRHIGQVVLRIPEAILLPDLHPPFGDAIAVNVIGSADGFGAIGVVRSGGVVLINSCGVEDGFLEIGKLVVRILEVREVLDRLATVVKAVVGVEAIAAVHLPSLLVLAAVSGGPLEVGN